MRMKPGVVYLAFYKGKGDFKDYLIRLFTRSRWSHCEVAYLPKNGSYSSSTISSSPRDGGLRIVSHQDLSEDNWHLVEVPWSTLRDVIDHYSVLKRGVRRKYDWVAIFLTHFLRLNIHSETNLTCSEACSLLLGLRGGFRWSPQDLYLIVSDLNKLYERTKGIETT
jgi:hypothetical protein